MTFSSTPPRRPRGFTLIELIVVILVLGVLAALAVVGYTQVTGRAQVAAAQANLHQFASAANKWSLPQPSF